MSFFISPYKFYYIKFDLSILLNIISFFIGPIMSLIIELFRPPIICYLTHELLLRKCVENHTLTKY